MRLLVLVRKYRADIVIFLMVVILFVVGVQHVFKADALQYEMMVKAFRGSASLEDVESPFRNRILVPLLASFLPFGPMESMQVVNFFFSVLLGMTFFRYMKSFSFDSAESLLGVVLLMFSQPFVVYGTKALTDVSSLFFIVLSLFLIRTGNKWILASASISLGMMSRETVIFVLPVFLYYALRSESRKALVWILGLIPIVILFSIRILTTLAVPSASNPTELGQFWLPTLDLTVSNVERMVNFSHLDSTAFGVWLAILPFVPLLVTAFRKRDAAPIFARSQREFLKVTFIFMSLLMLYGLSAAYFDSRFVWVLYPVLIPIGLKGYSNWSGIWGLRMIKRIVDRIAHSLV